MSQTAKAQEPSMEEILASIRRIIADDDGGPAKTPEPAPSAAPPPAAVAESEPAPPPASVNNQSDIDAMMADLDEPAREQPAPPPPAMAPSTAEVFELTEAHVAPQPAPSFRTIEGDSDVIFTDHVPEPEPVVEEPAPQATAPDDHALLSNATTAAVDSAFNSLAATVLGHNARTLEDLVKEMLRPLLKSWLDDNLPGLVERIVRTEIERVSRGKP